jgi:prevent-host-death family protein
VRYYGKGNSTLPSASPYPRPYGEKELALLQTTNKSEVSFRQRYWYTKFSLPDLRGQAAAEPLGEKSHFVLNSFIDRPEDSAMKTMSAREAKNAFGLMIDTARAEPVLIEKHGRGVVMVIAVEEYERLRVRPDAPGKTVGQRTEAIRE